jgi:hypothetical protein
MKRMVALAGAVLVVSIGVALAASDEIPQMPEPQKEHQWLQQLAGEWECDVECFLPEQPVMKSKGTESVRSVGGFWVLAENRGEFQGAPFHGILTLGYDAEGKKYVGTWVDSMSGHLWTYEGSVDAAGRALTLEAEGPCCMTPGKDAKFREVLEVKDKDHKTFRSAVQGEDGKWIPMMSIEYRRKK